MAWQLFFSGGQSFGGQRGKILWWRGGRGIMKIKFWNPGGLNPSAQEGILWGGS